MPHLNAASWSWLPAWRGEADDTLLAWASLLLTLSRDWEGNGASHDTRKDVKLTADAGARILILISQGWQVSTDSVMPQLQPIKCV